MLPSLSMIVHFSIYWFGIAKIHAGETMLHFVPYFSAENLLSRCAKLFQ
jgi:hypothetical protein